MEDQGFGVYGFYFKLLRNFGAFPYKIEYPGTKLSFYTGGIFKWFYYLNFVAVVFSAAFQFAQLLLTITYAPDPMNVIAQLCWMFAIMIPFSNMISFVRKEVYCVNSVNAWCELERSVIGSSLRGMANMPKGPLPTMSACHTKQTKLFKKMSTMYILMGAVAFVGMCFQVVFMPRFPAFLYSVSEADDVLLKHISTGYQIWLLFLIWIHTYCTEVIMIIVSGSISHCIETLSYRGAVVMANNQCDVPNLNEVLIKNWAAFEGVMIEGKSKGGSGGMNTGSAIRDRDGSGRDGEKTGSAMEQRKEPPPGKGFNQETYYLAHVVQNVVDIQYALDRYKDVEAVVDSINNSFGKMLFYHEGVYMSLMCTLFYTPIRYGSIIPFEGCVLFSIVGGFYLVRLFTFFPAMGRINVLSQLFTQSWMEGLRHIPKGKYAYEFYMHKLESCRRLAFDSGGFFIMQKGTVLTFVSIVTTHVIVLLQLY